MRSLRAVFIGCLWLWATPVADAKSEFELKGARELSVGAGFGAPLSDMKLLAASGANFTLAYGHYLSMSPVEVTFEFSYHKWNVGDSLQAVSPSLQSWTMFHLTANGKMLLLPGRLTPYIKVLAGIYNFSDDVSGFFVSGTSSLTDFGMGAGLGVQYASRETVGVAVDATLHRPFRSGASLMFVDVSARLLIFVWD